MSSIGIKDNSWPGREETAGEEGELLVLVVLPVVAGRAQPQLVVHLLTMENYAYYERGEGEREVG